MKIRYLTLLALSFLMFQSCSNDDVVETDVATEDPIVEEPEEEEEEEPVNSAPTAFSLLQLENETINSELQPTLSWQTAVDDDGDAVTYDVYLDQQEAPETKIAENISDTEITLSVALEKATTYYWRVVAHDTNSAETESNSIFKFTTSDIGLSETAVGTGGLYMPRFSHQTVVFQGKVWLIGGYGQFSNLGDGDVWSSINGIDFTLENKNAFSKPLWNPTCVVFNDKIWLFDSDGDGDILSSSNGKDWVVELEDAPFQAREDHSITVWNNKLWVIGGYDPYYEGPSTDIKETNDVWSSEDGVNWTLVTADAGFPARKGHSTVVFNNQLYLFAGYGLNRTTSTPYVRNDIWTSTDGENWTEVNANNLFEGRNGQTAFVYENRIWMVAGATLAPSISDPNYLSYTPQNDVWYTEDGITWIEQTPNSNFGARMNHSSVVFDNKAFINAGWYLDDDSSSYLNDIWTIQ